MKVYIAGPMSGYEDYNYPAFEKAEKELAALGYEPVSPHHTGVQEGWEWVDYMKADIAKLLTADAVATLPGWVQSKGARAEVSLAEGLEMPVKPLWLWKAIA